jgi:hypothetical protein
MRRLVECLVIVALIVAACHKSAWAEAGALDSPGLSFAENYPASAREQAMKAVKGRDAKFLGGHYVNWVTTLRYAGGAKALNAMIADLAKCPASVVSVQFRKNLDDADWEVSHTPAGTP